MHYPKLGRLGVRGRRDILEGSHGPGSQVAWVMVRAGRVPQHTWPVRSCTQSHSKAKAAWESGVGVVMEGVAMIRASRGPGLWLGRVRSFGTWPVRYRALSHANNMQPCGTGVKGIVGDDMHLAITSSRCSRRS